MVRNVDADVESLPAAKQERLGRLLARTGTDGVDFVNALDQTSLDSFLTIRRTAAPDGGEDVTDLTKTVLVRESNDLTDAEIQSRVESVSTTYNRLDTDQAKAELARTIQESGDDGIYLAEEVSAGRIQTLVDDGIDLKRHADGIGAYRRSGKTADDAGELTELFAQERVLRPEFEGSETVYPPRNIDTTGVKIVNSNGKEIAEFDGMTRQRFDDIVEKEMGHFEQTVLEEEGIRELQTAFEDAITRLNDIEPELNWEASLASNIVFCEFALDHGYAIELSY